MEPLKTDCENHLSLTLNIDSVCSTLLYADMCAASTLKENCCKFIIHYSSDVISTEGWKMLVATDHSELVVEVLTRAVNKKL